MYGCLYLLFEAYPIVFTEGHGFDAGSIVPDCLVCQKYTDSGGFDLGVSGLMFLPITIGGVAGVVLVSRTSEFSLLINMTEH